MICSSAGKLSIAAIALLIAVAPSAQGGQEPPKMTPEQQAEMEAYMKAGTPGGEHEKLAAMAGTYELEVKSWMDPSAPPMVESATSTRRMTLDGRVLVEEFSGSMMGTPFTGHGMQGYDNVTGEYWATWTDSMSTGIMLSTGSCDADMSCTYTGSWNDPVKKGPVTARMKSRWTGPSTQIFEMYGPGKDGKEMKMMEITYKKK